MISKTIFTIEGCYRDNWEPVPEGEFDTEREARDGMEVLEQEAGFRNLRVVQETIRDNVVVAHETVLYGLDDEEDGEK